MSPAHLMGPRLPPELYRQIFENFHPRDDLGTLLSTSVASRTLAEESQRILFRAGPLNLQEHRARSDKVVTVKTLSKAYTAFLEAILDNENSLAGYVHQYEHFSQCEVPTSLASEKLMSLVTRALPLMKNLKGLSVDISYFNDTHMEALCNSTFQLQSLKVVFRYSHWSPILLSRFLHRQQALHQMDIHQSFWNIRGHVNIDTSVDNMLPALTSLQTNDIQLWTRLQPKRDIKALCLQWPGVLTEEHMSTLINVRYLRLMGTEVAYLTHAGGIEPNIELKAEVLDIDDKKSLFPRSAYFTSHLPHVRLLVLRGKENDFITPSSSMSCEAGVAFIRFPCLLYLVVPNKYHSKGAFLYRRKSGYDILTDGTRALEELDFEFDRCVVQATSADWWMRWVDILSNEKTQSISYSGHPSG